MPPKYECQFFVKYERYDIIEATGGDTTRVNEERNDAYEPTLKAARLQPLSCPFTRNFEPPALRQKGYFYVQALLRQSQSDP